MRDPYADNNLVDYCTVIFNFVTYLLDLHFSFYSLPSNGPQLSWAPGLTPAKSCPDSSLLKACSALRASVVEAVLDSA